MNNLDPELAQNLNALFAGLPIIAFAYLVLTRFFLANIVGKGNVNWAEKGIAKLFRWLARQIYRFIRWLILGICRGITRLYRWLRTP